MTTENREYWSGNAVNSLQLNEIFCFGSNPAGRHGAGAAKVAVNFGAQYGQGRGLAGNTYALITKNLTAGFTEKATGITYDLEGPRSVSLEMITENIRELYETARNNPEKKFLIAFTFDTWPNGSDKKSLNGYTSTEIFNVFTDLPNIPNNIVFHDSYQQKLEKKLGIQSTNNNASATNLRHDPVKEEYTFFFHQTSPFSQWHPARFTYKEFTFLSTEQFMMFSKAKTFKDEAVASRLMNIENEFIIEQDQFAPKDKLVFKSQQAKIAYETVIAFRKGEITNEQILGKKETKDAWFLVQETIKKLGREVANYNEAIWNGRRFNVVAVANREKFGQNEHLKAILMATGNTVMVEASPYDKIWGIGLAANHPDAKNPAKWRGLNLLGQVLTQLKKHFLELDNSNSNQNTNINASKLKP
jgi:ribA/ribD-fused uncharacterized protein